MEKFREHRLGCQQRQPELPERLHAGPVPAIGPVEQRENRARINKCIGNA